MQTPLTLRVDVEKWPLKAPFRITGHTMLDCELVVVTLIAGDLQGRGEAEGVYYRGDDVAAMVKNIEAVRPRIEAGIDRESLQQLLPPGGARNALDCALWDLDAKRTQRPVWQLAGLEEPKPILTAHTLGADSPEAMAEGARGYREAKLLKLKLTGEPIDPERIR